MPGWVEATRVQQLDAQTYSSTLHDDWCIGSVPNGGYVTGSILEVVATHFRTTLAEQNQPHTIALHVEFFRRTQAGPAIYKVENVKLGRQTSAVHVRMSQDGREEIAAYVTNSNMDTEQGPTLDVGFQLQPPRPPVDFVKLSKDTDPQWKRQYIMPHAGFRKATKRVEWYFPREHSLPNGADQWCRFSDGSNFTDTSIGFVADMFPQLLERYKKAEQVYWYPTLVLNLDIKKALPPGGLEWFGIRVQTKQVLNGRFDLEVSIYDHEGSLVALSNHAALAVDASKNLAPRRNVETKL